jgi:hypothetical protein
MAARLRQFLFWLATIIAGVLVARVVWGYVYTSIRGKPLISVVPLLLELFGWRRGSAARCSLIAEGCFAKFKLMGCKRRER